MKYEYPISEFQNHLRALGTRSTEGTIFERFSFLRGYFGEFYEDDEATEKMEIYVTASAHLASHADDYDTELFAVSEGDSSIWISEELQFAVHWFFTTQDLSQWTGGMDTVHQIKMKAKSKAAENKAARATLGGG